jgi:hypothetical protein
VGKKMSVNIVDRESLRAFGTNDEMVSFFQLNGQKEFFKLKSLRITANG